MAAAGMVGHECLQMTDRRINFTINCFLNIPFSRYSFTMRYELFLSQRRFKVDMINNKKIWNHWLAATW
jgi:hypothetical protein